MYIYSSRSKQAANNSKTEAQIMTAAKQSMQRITYAVVRMGGTWDSVTVDVPESQVDVDNSESTLFWAEEHLANLESGYRDASIVGFVVLEIMPVE